MGADTKRQLLDHCIEKVNERLAEINYAIQQAQDAIENETKSSAGDKYETSREMIQQDLNRYNTQLVQAKKDWMLLQKMDIGAKETAELGAVVETDQVTYFMAISLGQQQVDGQHFMVVSPSSPIGKLLLGSKTGEQISFNDAKQLIIAVY